MRLCRPEMLLGETQVFRDGVEPPSQASLPVRGHLRANLGGEEENRSTMCYGRCPDYRLFNHHESITIPSVGLRMGHWLLPSSAGWAGHWS